MIRFASRDPVEPLFFDPPGVVRASMPRIGFEGLLNSAFEQIRLYAKGDVAVSLRLLRALTDIASTTQNSKYRTSLVQMGERVVAGCAERLNESELRDLRARQETLESSLRFGLHSKLPGETSYHVIVLMSHLLPHVAAISRRLWVLDVGSARASRRCSSAIRRICKPTSRKKPSTTYISFIGSVAIALNIAIKLLSIRSYSA
jgi:Predicted membrane protein (DUF2254)